MISKKERDSNIELLRVIAMFLVLLVHADFFSLGAPTMLDIQTNTLDRTLRIFFEALSIVCVNVFVLISGWFGIRPCLRGASTFIFQCLFFLIGLYIITLLIGTSSFSLNGILGCFAATKSNWFIKAYLLLYIISPVLNAFVEHTSKSTFRNVLIAFFAFTCTYGWRGAAEFMLRGYTPLFFIGLYLLARYIRIYQPWFSRFSTLTYVSLYIFFSILVTVFCIIPSLYLNIHFQPYWDYISPSTIICSIFLFIAFTKFRFNSKFVNWCGASSFAVFLLHTNPNTLEHYKYLFVSLHSKLSPLEFWVATFIILTVIFFLAILIDQLRIFLWNKTYPVIDKLKK